MSDPGGDVRGPRALEALAVIGVAFVLGAAAARVRGGSAGATANPPPEVHAPASPDLANLASPDASSAEDASLATGDAASDARDEGPSGYTIDDVELPPFDPEKTDDVDALLAYVPMTVRDEASIAAARKLVGPGRNHVNQGNHAISEHAISREQCVSGLKGVVLQTKEARAICGGPFEVPIHAGDPKKATACIDVFEYPNLPCALPFVFSSTITASKLCALAGKRLCTQEEWNQACEGDPNGGPPTNFAYGDQLDLEICANGIEKSRGCDVDNALWKSCGTHTVPSGSFPRCRSRLGVYDQHGNVAEAMTRRQGGVTWAQLKGSAFFYDGKMYADGCRFDPRWHVDPADESWHTNYHLGFRCCRPLEPSPDAG